jgi:uncharacterized membrane protein YfcA
MDLQWFAAYLILGIFVGFLAGLLGVGGGAIMVPVLTTMFMMQKFSGENVVHMALATSMAAIVVTTWVSFRAHDKREAVLWPVVRKIVPGILLGTFLGTFVASAMSSVPLTIFFSVFIAIIAVQMLLDIKPKPSRNLPGSIILGSTGAVIGFISALVAIGGGSMTVPFLTWCNVKIRSAIGTSSAVGFPLSVAGTIGYLFSGWGTNDVPEYTFGYIYLPAVFLISLASFTITPYGVKTAHKISTGILKKIFAVILVVLSAKMLHTVYGFQVS